MKIHKRSTVLTVTLLSVTLLTTGCIQKKERVINHAPSVIVPQQQISVGGAKTVPYTEPVVQYTQPSIQITQPQSQPTYQKEPRVQQTVQYTQPIEEPPVEYTQPAPVQYSTQPTPSYTTTEYDEVECTDDVTPGESNCDRGSIDKSQLSSNYTPNSSNGTMHSLKSIQGQTIQIGERSNGFTFPNHPGKVIILEMFGQNCPHCIKEVPTLKRIKSRYGNRIEVIGIHSQGILSPSAGRRFINRHGVNYPITDGSRATDLQYFIQNTYGWTGVLPFTMVIKDGQTEGSISGEASYKELREILDPLF